MPSKDGDVRNASQQTAVSPWVVHHEVCGTCPEAAREGHGSKAMGAKPNRNGGFQRIVMPHGIKVPSAGSSEKM